MKTFNKLFLSCGVAAAAMGMTSCVNDLDLLPIDPNQITAGEFAADPEGYMNRVLGDVYMNFATYGANGSSTVTQFDGGMSTFARGIFILEEMPTDEANWLPTGDVEYGVLQYGPIPSNSPIAGGIYSRLTINITLCNDFIKTVNDGLFQIESEAVKAKAQEYVRQCKILRSACFYYLIDLYGNVPYADENTPVGSITAQMNRADITRQVIADLENVVAEYGNNNDVVYGFVGKEVAQALLVKFYLNAGVYTGQNMWDKALATANAIIANHKGTGMNGTGLAEHYHALFGHNNYEYALGDASASPKEIIWTLPQNEPNLKSWANATFMINGFIGSATMAPAVCDLSRWNMSSGWRCMSARRQFVEKFDWNDDFTASPDVRTSLWCTAAHGFNINNDVLDQDHYGQNGFIPVKYHNWNVLADGSFDGEGITVMEQVPVDFAMIRLAEIYLSAAEAAYQTGDKTTALTYCNYIRERAGLEAWTAADCNLESIYDERCRELYTEGTRRTDLIRANKWVSGYTWNWKNSVKYGADLPPTSVLYPLPSAVVEANGYAQNPGY